MMERRTLSPFAESLDGLVLPVSLGGHPALDFCNTLAGWSDAKPGDYLRTYGHLSLWAEAQSLLEPGAGSKLRRLSARRPEEAAGALERARAFRRDLYAVLLAPRAGARWDRVAALVTEAERASGLVLG